MPRIISIDNVQVAQIQLIKDTNGALRVYAQYSLKAGGEVIRPAYRDVTDRLSAARRAAVQALFDGLAQDVSGIEQV